MSFGAQAAGVVAGAEQIDAYIGGLQGKKVGILTNHTGMVGGRHLVDTLLSLGVNVLAVFAPEHGFRGDADAGEKVGSYVDPKTGVNVISIYGSSRKPKQEDVRKLDVVLFDIQDVGLRYYTYLSSMHLMMETCAETGVPMIVLDRPNPNGMYIDGPVIETKYRSFVGMHPIPVVHGMTLGELAQMINGERWLAGGCTCELTVVPCRNYTHATRYALPVAPSPNLPNMRSVYLYSALCCMEGTVVSIGRGTDFPFQVCGHSALRGNKDFPFTFTPRVGAAAKNPPQKDRLCYGIDLRQLPDDEYVIAHGVDLSYVIACYRAMPQKADFFNSMFEKLLGVSYIREMIVAGKSAKEIKARWKNDVESFRTQRKPYLLYEE